MNLNRRHEGNLFQLDFASIPIASTLLKNVDNELKDV